MPNQVGQEQHVLIIGAGITGLLIAQGFKKAGIKYSIFEKESSASRVRKGEWGMTIHWSKPLLEQILPPAILDRLHAEAQVDPSFDASQDYVIPFWNGKLREHIKDAPTPYAIRVSRTKLRTLLAEGLNIQYGKSLDSVEFESANHSIKANFEDQTHQGGTLLVGADGHRSKVRELLFGRAVAAPKIVGEGFQLGWITICYGDATKARAVRELHPINTAAFHPDKPFMMWSAVVDVPNPEKPEDWVFQLMPGWAGLKDPEMSNAQVLAHLKEMVGDMADPWRSSLLWVPDDHEIITSDVTAWETVAWDNHAGRITLCGDAAHAMPPHRGQGLNHSIQDAVNLVKAVQNCGEIEDLKMALDEYDAEVVKRGSDEVRTSVESAILTHDFKKLMQAPVMRQGYVKTELK